jgi:hypothetical protein
MSEHVSDDRLNELIASFDRDPNADVRADFLCALLELRRLRNVNLLPDLVEALREARGWADPYYPEAIALVAKIDALIAKATA